MENTFERIESTSESESSSSEEEVNYENPTHFMNMTSQEEYEKNRNSLFTKNTETKNILIQTRTSSATFTINFDTDLKIDAVKNVIGFNLVRAGIKHANSSYLTIDLIISEIPHTACKINNEQVYIIDKIPVNQNTTSIYNYKPYKLYNNYFYPISLNTLSFTLKAWTGSAYADISGTTDVFFEFELTVLNNLKLLR